MSTNLSHKNFKLSEKIDQKWSLHLTIHYNMIFFFYFIVKPKNLQVSSCNEESSAFEYYYLYFWVAKVSWFYLQIDWKTDKDRVVLENFPKYPSHHQHEPSYVDLWVTETKKKIVKLERDLSWTLFYIMYSNRNKKPHQPIQITLAKIATPFISKPFRNGTIRNKHQR